MSTGIYIASLLGAAAAALGLTPLSVVMARRWGVLDLPGVRKVHGSPTPRLGGAAIALATLGCAAAVALATGLVAADHRWAAASFAVAALVVFAVGIVDDLVGIRSNLKLAALVAAAVTVCAAGVRIDAVLLNGRDPVQLGWLAWPLTVFWIVAVTVSLNFIDGLDGLAGGIAAIAAAVIALTAAVHGAHAVAVVALALCGALAGFLVFNREPASVFMGDGGSMFVGFTLACLAVLQHPASGSTAGLLLPALALAIPLLDTGFTVVRRGVIHRSLFAAERDHIHHRLMAVGLCPRHAVYVLHGATVASAGVGLLALTDSGWATLGGLAILVPLLLGLFRTAGSTRVRETVAAVRRNRAIARQARGYQRAFEELLPRFREATSFTAWWDAVCAAAQELDFMAVSLPVVRRDGTRGAMRWCRDDGRHLDAEVVSVTVPVAHRRHGPAMRLSADLATTQFLEVAGQRVALLARLVGDHSVASLPDATKRVKALGPRAEGAALKATPPESDVAPATSAPPPAVAAEDAIGLLNTWPSTAAAVTSAGGQAAAPRAGSAARPAGGKPRVAIVHDFLYCYAGAERVLEQIIRVYPDADLFALFDFLPPGQRGFLLDKPVTTTFIQRLPLAGRKHRLYLPLMPLAIEQLDVSNYDVVISSSYLAAKGVITRPDQLHVCYCHTPVRFAWDLQNQYLAERGLVAGLKSFLARVVLHYIRNWDVRSAGGVDVFLSNSDYVGRRIRKVYRRSSTTIHPPVDTEVFVPGPGPKEDFYLTASRLVPYKRVDLIVEAFRRMPDKRLVVIGDGPEFERIKALAGPNVRLVGHQSHDRLVQYMQLARAFVFAGEEDFGIVPVEAQACGTPVVAFGRGGVTETVLDGTTGVFFGEQAPAAIVDAVERFEQHGPWDPRPIRAHAERFAAGVFRRHIAREVAAHWAATTGTPAVPPGPDAPAAAELAGSGIALAETY